jgi:hypothetical protein
MARLDRLGSAKEIAQISAAIGREFPFEVFLRSPSAARLSLSRRSTGLWNRAFCSKYVSRPIRPSCSSTRSSGTRPAVPARVLNGSFPQTRDTQPEILAHHYFQAGASESALEWWGKAGDRALRCSAIKEAIVHLSKAVALANGATQNGIPKRSNSERLRLQIAYGQALMWGSVAGGISSISPNPKGLTLPPAVRV